MPTFAQLDESDVDIVVAGTASDIIMSRAAAASTRGGHDRALEFATQNIRKIVAVQNEL